MLLELYIKLKPIDNWGNIKVTFEQTKKHVAILNIELRVNDRVVLCVMLFTMHAFYCL